MRTSALLRAKTSDFLKFKECPHWQEEGVGWASSDILQTRGRG